FHKSLTVILVPIAPPYHVELLKPPHETVLQQANHANEGHSGYYQVISVPGVPGIDDQEPEPGIDRDHFSGHHDQPGYPQADPHADDNLGQSGKKDDHAPEFETTGPEILGGPEILPFNGMDASDGLHHHGEKR